MKYPIRILQITGGMNIGGIENFIMNVYRNIDRDKIQFDFLIHQEEKQIFEEEILALGGKIYRIHSFRSCGFFNYVKSLNKFFKEHSEYKIVHSHYNEISGIILLSAMWNKIKYRVSHSHTAYPKYNNFLEKYFAKILIILIKIVSNKKLSCSKEAGEWLFGKTSSFKIMKNGIDLKKFLFDIEKRKIFRKNLEIENNELALVNISRLTYQKNHSFLLEIMKKLNEVDSKIKIFLIGDGELEETLKQKIEKEKIENIKFLGSRKDVSEIINSMDIMVFPSFAEGLGIVAIEAQSNGLQVLASENVPKEADMDLGLFKSLSIEDVDIWVKEILKIKNSLVRQQEKEQIEKILQSKYNILIVAKELENFYLELR